MLLMKQRLQDGPLELAYEREEREVGARWASTFR